jgi:glycosyltransferase involved in cell wall biosynthesis
VFDEGRKGRERIDTVVISAGFHKTHVTTAAREASVRGLLRLAITAAYPTETVKRIARFLRIEEKGRVARLFERDEGIPGSQMSSLFLPELLDEGARLFAGIPLIGRLYDRLSVASWRLYGRLAARKLSRERDARIYHFRAGFGHTSIDRARELGMLTLCDHAIAHPSLLKELIENRGKLPEAAGEPAPSGDSALSHPLTRAMLADINRSDAVLVNSDFVKETFLRVGWSPDRVHVVYLGVDDNFRPKELVKRVPEDRGRLQLLFAGRLETRKGAEVLVEALRGLHDLHWELLVAGPVEAEIDAAYGDFLADDRIKLLGTLRRPDLMELMTSVPVFIFPSFAEGSARAVFEALACGCYVITTPNSGTIVEDGVHGALIPPGDAERLASAIVDADRNRQMVAEIGSRNAQLVAERFRQKDYGDDLAVLYRMLADDPEEEPEMSVSPRSDS